MFLKKIDNRVLATLVTGLIPLGAAIPAYADSGVELSGRVDMGLVYQDDGASDKNELSAAGNSWTTSRLTLLGFHDLNDSGDLKAVFNLETGFNPANGKLSNDTFLNRVAYTGLESVNWGRLVLGRDYSLSANMTVIDPFHQQTTSSGALVGGRVWAKMTNMVAYKSPTWNGWSFQLQQGLGNDDASYHDGRRDAAQVSYDSEAVTFHAVYDEFRDDAGKYSSIFKNSRQLITGIVWHVDSWDLFAGYNRLDADDASSKDLATNPLSNGVANKANQYWLGANWASPSNRWNVQGAIYQIDVSGVSDADKAKKVSGHATLAAVATTYNFSNDFYAYGSFGRVFNSNDNTNFVAQDGATLSAYGLEQNVIYVGFVYQFKAGLGAYAAK